MTEFRRRNYGRGHAYYLGDRKLDGVTTVISKGLPKPALVQWAANCAADLACDEWDTLAELPLSERRKRLAKAPDVKRNAAAAKGTRIHALAEPLAHGKQVDVPPELAGHVESCVRFLDEWEPETAYSEFSVYHDRYLYAGTGDLIADMRGQRWLLDWKTSASGAYGDTAFQLAAYKYATHLLDTEPGAGDMVVKMPPVDQCGVVWLRGDGYDVYPYHVDEAVFRQFLYIQQTAKAAEACRDYKGDALLPPVRSHA